MMNKKLFLCSMILLLGNITIQAFDILAPVYWLKNRLVPSCIIRKKIVYNAEGVEEVNERAMVQSLREVTFENNLGTFFSQLQEDPTCGELAGLVDQNVIVNGNPIIPGTSKTLLIENDQCIITIKLYRGMAKLIYAMQYGRLRGILMRFLKRLEPWLQWQYTFVCNVSRNLDRVQLSDIILYAYSQAQDLSAVNTRFKFTIVVELTLNDTLNL